MPYELIEDNFWNSHVGHQPGWVKSLVRNKIDEIRELDDPQIPGREYRGKWVYPAGKVQIVVAIDDVRHQTRLLKLIKLPSKRPANCRPFVDSISLYKNPPALQNGNRGIV